MSSSGAWSTCPTGEQGIAMLGQCAGRWHSTTRTTSSLSQYTPRISLILTTISEGNSERPRDSIYHHNRRSSPFTDCLKSSFVLLPLVLDIQRLQNQHPLYREVGLKESRCITRRVGHRFGGYRREQAESFESFPKSARCNPYCCCSLGGVCRCSYSATTNS